MLHFERYMILGINNQSTTLSISSIYWFRVRFGIGSFVSSLFPLVIGQTIGAYYDCQMMPQLLVKQLTELMKLAAVSHFKGFSSNCCYYSQYNDWSFNVRDSCMALCDLCPPCYSLCRLSSSFKRRSSASIWSRSSGKLTCNEWFLLFITHTTTQLIIRTS